MLKIATLTCKITALKEELAVEVAKTYKTNSKKVHIGGHADDMVPTMSITAINANKKARKIAMLEAEIKSAEVELFETAYSLKETMFKEMIAKTAEIKTPCFDQFDPFAIFLEGLERSEEMKAYDIAVANATAHLHANMAVLDDIIAKTRPAI